jgi:putative membrane protein
MSMSSKASPAVASVACTLAAGLLTLLLLELGPLSAQMAWHIGAMNVAAPLAALAVAPRLPPGDRQGAFWMVCVLQIVLLWGSHAPSFHHALMQPVVATAIHAALFAVALAFWVLLLDSIAHSAWQALLGLLLTGKLACLLGALLVLAPRPLYTGAELADQQLAGLLMVTACPLSYLVAGVVVAARLIAGAGARVADVR